MQKAFFNPSSPDLEKQILRSVLSVPSTEGKLRLPEDNFLDGILQEVPFKAQVTNTGHFIVVGGDNRTVTVQLAGQHKDKQVPLLSALLNSGSISNYLLWGFFQDEEPDKLLNRSHIKSVLEVRGSQEKVSTNDPLGVAKTLLSMKPLLLEKSEFQDVAKVSQTVGIDKGPTIFINVNNQDIRLQ